MEVSIISQIGIGMFASVAFILITSESKLKQKWGTIIGLISVPFWWAMAIQTEQWITFPAHALFTYGWIRLFYRQFIKKN